MERLLSYNEQTGLILGLVSQSKTSNKNVKSGTFFKIFRFLGTASSKEEIILEDDLALVGDHSAPVGLSDYRHAFTSGRRFYMIANSSSQAATNFQLYEFSPKYVESKPIIHVKNFNIESTLSNKKTINFQLNRNYTLSAVHLGNNCLISTQIKIPSYGKIRIWVRIALVNITARKMVDTLDVNLVSPEALTLKKTKDNLLVLVIKDKSAFMWKAYKDEIIPVGPILMNLRRFLYKVPEGRSEDHSWFWDTSRRKLILKLLSCSNDCPSGLSVKLTKFSLTL